MNDFDRIGSSNVSVNILRSCVIIRHRFVFSRETIFLYFIQGWEFSFSLQITHDSISNVNKQEKRKRRRKSQ